MDVQTIAVRTGLPVRMIRYVLDHRLLPGLRAPGLPGIVGRARTFTDLEGFGVACAAVLLESGVRKQAVIALMTGLCQFPVDTNLRGKRPVYAIQKAFDPGVAPAEALLADGVNLRVRFFLYDSGWIQPRTYAPLGEGYCPRAMISLDLARLRNEFRRRR